MYINSSNGPALSAICPKCGIDAYRIIVSPSNGSIHLSNFCAKCHYIGSLPEPQLNKIVIYLDQFVVSEIEKIKAGKKFQKGFDKLFDLLLSLAKHQLAIFPSSNFHAHETLYLSNSKQRDSMQTILELLARGTSFKDPDTIVNIVLIHHLHRAQLQTDKILYGDRNSWHAPEFTCILPIDYKNGNFREDFRNNINAYFKKGSKSTENILDEITGEYSKHCMRHDIQKLFEEKSHDINSTLKKLDIFRIIAVLLREITNDFSRGDRKKGINKGMASDILMIAHILPYVDAIFLDNDMHNLLHKSNEAYVPIEYKQRIYSTKGINQKNNLQSFIEFLNYIEKNDFEHSYSPFVFQHSQLVEAYYRKPETSSPLSLLKKQF